MVVLQERPAKPSDRGRRHLVVRLGLPVALAAVMTAGCSSSAPETSTVGSRGLGDPYFPGAGNGGYQVRHYSLDLGYDPKARHLDGRAEISAQATSGLKRFDLDLKGLKVKRVTVDGVLAAHRRDGQELVVTPRQPLRKGHDFRVTVVYSGTPKPIPEEDGAKAGWLPTDDGAVVASEPNGSMSWFPVNNHPRDKASYEIAVTVPRGYTAVANGVLTGQRTAAGRTTFRWRQSEPMASYLVTATVGRFQVERYTAPGGIEVYNAVDAREAADAKPVLEKLPSVLTWAGKTFGRYPYRAAGAIVDHAPELDGALETQTRPVYDEAPDLSTLVHETAHQWFGNSVTVTTWKDIWLNEGFATYAEWLYEEQHEGPPAQETFDELYAKPADHELWDLPPADPGSGAHIFDTPVYDRGAMALHQLRRTVGTQTFLDILRTWAADHRHGHGTTKQFVHLAERISGKELNSLFTKWIGTKGKPEQP